MPNTLESILVLLLFLAPGYIMREAISAFRPKQERTQFETIIDSLILSVVNFVIAFLLIGLLVITTQSFSVDIIMNQYSDFITLPKDPATKLTNIQTLIKYFVSKEKFDYIPILFMLFVHPIVSFIFTIFYFLINPIVQGMMISKWKGSVKLFSWTIIDSRINPYQTSWDEFFATTGPVIVLVTLNSGEKLCGVYQGNSRAGTKRNERDLYLENELLLDKKDRILGYIENSRGLWVKREEIQHLKFLPLKILEN